MEVRPEGEPEGSEYEVDRAFDETEDGMKMEVFTGPANTTFSVYVNGQQVCFMNVLGDSDQKEKMVGGLKTLVERLQEAFTGNHIQVHRSWIQIDDAWDMRKNGHYMAAKVMALTSALATAEYLVGKQDGVAVREMEAECVDRLIALLEKERFVKDESVRGEGTGDPPVPAAGIPCVRVSKSGGPAGVDPARVDSGMPAVEQPHHKRVSCGDGCDTCGEVAVNSGQEGGSAEVCGDHQHDFSRDRECTICGVSEIDAVFETWRFQA
jgi:hypothetical protein